MDYGYLTLVAPILTLAVAIATRKVPLAMLVGIFTGQLIICGWNPFTAINESVNGIFLSVCADTVNLKTFLFTALMGAFVILVRISGGVKGFVNYLTEQSKRVKSPRMAMLIAYVIGIIIFIDGLLSIMFTGVVTRPLIDKFKVSREKLAYICDATSAPVNAIIPLNSWGAMLMGLISAEIASGYIQGEPMNLLIRSLPFQFYSILSLLFVLFYIVTGKDWGPMKKAELRVRNTGKLYDDGVTPLLNDNDGFEELVEEGSENKWNMMFPAHHPDRRCFHRPAGHRRRKSGGGRRNHGDPLLCCYHAAHYVRHVYKAGDHDRQGVRRQRYEGCQQHDGSGDPSGAVLLHRRGHQGHGAPASSLPACWVTALTVPSARRSSS